uniref:Uncharacterized protein n=1 Tax=Strigamia maritima TaxID=126957 RepID=T1J9A5_STRMM
MQLEECYDGGFAISQMNAKVTRVQFVVSMVHQCIFSQAVFYYCVVLATSSLTNVTSHTSKPDTNDKSLFQLFESMEKWVNIKIEVRYDHIQRETEKSLKKMKESIYLQTNQVINTSKAEIAETLNKLHAAVKEQNMQHVAIIHALNELKSQHAAVLQTVNDQKRRFFSALEAINADNMVIDHRLQVLEENVERLKDGMDVVSKMDGEKGIKNDVNTVKKI